MKPTNENLLTTSFKFIGISNLKGEHSINARKDSKIIEVIKELKSLYNDNLPPIESISLTYKAKKIDILKSFEELNLNEENVKFNLSKGVENSDILDYLKGIKKDETNSKDKVISINHEGSIIGNNKQKAIQTLIEMGYKEDLIKTVIDSTNREYLLKGPEIIVEKSLILLKSMIKDNIKPDEYYINYKNSQENSNEMGYLISNTESIKSNYIIDFNGSNISSVFSYGNGLKGQLGNSEFLKSNKLLRINFFSGIKVKDISCGLNVCMALDYNGYCYTWGEFFYPYEKDSITGKREYKSGQSATPKLVESLTNEIITSIGCGARHYLAINLKGQIFTWGEGLKGQLGHGILDNELYPRKIDRLYGLIIKKAIGGNEHTILISSESVLIGFGSNEKNQLGLYDLEIVANPMILPIYEFLGHYPINNQNLENNLKTNDQSNKVRGTYESYDLSKDYEDLIKIKLLHVGTWFTICTSFINSNIIFFFGNKNQKILRIEYFVENNINILDIKASGNYFSVKTPYKIYVFDVTKLNKDPIEIDVLNLILNQSFIYNLENVDYLPEYDIHQTDDYLLINSNKGLLKYYFKTNVLSNIDDNLLFPISKIYASNYHFLLMIEPQKTLSEYLFKEISESDGQKDVSSEENIGKSENIIINDIPFKNCNSTINNFNNFYINSVYYQVKIPCHKFILNKLINLDDNSNNLLIVNNVINIDLSGEEILILLEILYYCKIKLFENLEAFRGETLNSFIKYLGNIVNFLNSDNIKFTDLSIKISDYIKLEILRLNLFIDIAVYSDKTEVNILKGMLLSTYFLLMNFDEVSKHNINMSNISDFNTKQNKTNNILNNNDDENLDNPEDEDFINSMNNRQTNYFDKLKEKGFAVNLFANELPIELGIKQSIDKFLGEKNFTDRRYNINKKLVELNSFLRESLKISLFESDMDMTIIFKDKKFNFNKKFFIYQSSLFCSDYCPNEYILEFDEVDLNDMNKFNLLLNNNNVGFNLTEIINLLKLSKYFMCYKILQMVEVAIISFLIIPENILSLLELSSEYNMKQLEQSIIIYIVKNFDNLKNIVELRGMSESNKNEVKYLKQLNNY